MPRDCVIRSLSEFSARSWAEQRSVWLDFPPVVFGGAASGRSLSERSLGSQPGTGPPGGLKANTPALLPPSQDCVRGALARAPCREPAGATGTGVGPGQCWGRAATRASPRPSPRPLLRRGRLRGSELLRKEKRVERQPRGPWGTCALGYLPRTLPQNQAHPEAQTKRPSEVRSRRCGAWRPRVLLPTTWRGLQQGRKPVSQPAADQKEHFGGSEFQHQSHAEPVLVAKGTVTSGFQFRGSRTG